MAIWPPFGRDGAPGKLVILTLGVGVDTNVLVFERIREELRHGKTARDAVHGGFARVWVNVFASYFVSKLLFEWALHGRSASTLSI